MCQPDLPPSHGISYPDREADQEDQASGLGMKLALLKLYLKLHWITTNMSEMSSILKNQERTIRVTCFGIRKTIPMNWRHGKNLYTINHRNSTKWISKTKVGTTIREGIQKRTQSSKRQRTVYHRQLLKQSSITCSYSGTTHQSTRTMKEKDTWTGIKLKELNSCTKISLQNRMNILRATSAIPFHKTQVS